MSAAAAKQIAVIFFIPIPVSTVQTFVVLKPVLGHMRVSYVNTATITVALAFLAAQTVYFVIARSRYVRALEKMMV